MDFAKIFVRKEFEPLDDIEACLQGQVFHVTKQGYLKAIIETGAILPNLKGTLPTTFGSSDDSFFRKRNCVSLFDYRGPLSEKVREYRGHCPFFKPARPPGAAIAILILDPAAYDKLVPWTRWHEENAQNELVVPYVEAGYPGPLPLSLISEAISLEIQSR